jgi:hypothetical protein
LVLHFDDWFCEAVDDDEMTDYPSGPNPHDFAFNIGDWLSICQDLRKGLASIFDGYVGYFSKLCLNRIKYPWLTVLKLTGFAFSHDTQVTWITTHGQALRILHLSDCPVLAEIVTYMIVDDKSYPVPNYTDTDVTILTNDLFWGTILGQFAIELRKLRDFKIVFPQYDRASDEQGTTPSQCKLYDLGQVYVSEDSKRIHAEHLIEDISAFIKLLMHTSQYRVAEEEETMLNETIMDEGNDIGEGSSAGKGDHGDDEYIETTAGQSDVDSHKPETTNQEEGSCGSYWF